MVAACDGFSYPILKLSAQLETEGLTVKKMPANKDAKLAAKESGTIKFVSVSFPKALLSLKPTLQLQAPSTALLSTCANCRSTLQVEATSGAGPSSLGTSMMVSPSHSLN